MLDLARKSDKGSALLEAPAETPKPPKIKAECAAPRAESSETSVRVVAEPPPPVPELPVEIRRPESRRLDLLRLADASAATLPVAAPLPSPSRPLHGPLILGALSYLGVLLLPLTIAFESHRVLGVLGFCMAGFFAPFAPIAWLVGLTAEKRRRDQGLRPEPPVSLGRLLGQWGTLILVSEVTLALIGIAALRLAGRFPVSFWAPVY
jgi:hypothetical protein